MSAVFLNLGYTPLMDFYGDGENLPFFRSKRSILLKIRGIRSRIHNPGLPIRLLEPYAKDNSVKVIFIHKSI